MKLSEQIFGDIWDFKIIVGENGGVGAEGGMFVFLTL
jgi:hypothetical protein